MYTLIKNCDWQGTRTDLLLRDSSIESIAPGITPPDGCEVLDAAGYVLLPPFVDAHAHLDKNVIGLPWMNHADMSLMETVEYERKMRVELGIDAAVQATRYLEQVLQLGTRHLRSHVDVDDFAGLKSLEGVVATRERYAKLASIEIVAFPQSGLLRPGVAELLDEALRSGADAVGSVDPATFDGDPVKSVTTTFDLAEKHGKKIDIHLHDPGELGLFTLDLIAAQALRRGMQGRVAVSHAFCLGSANTGWVERTRARLAEAEVLIVSTFQYPTAPLLKPLLAAGVRVATGNDNVRDLWSGHGTGDMLERARYVAMRNSFETDADLTLAAELCTTHNARHLGIANYGIAEGNPADFVLVRAQCVPEAVVALPHDRIVYIGGERYSPKN